jgi:hypothetical protein
MLGMGKCWPISTVIDYLTLKFSKNSYIFFIHSRGYRCIFPLIACLKSSSPLSALRSPLSAHRSPLAYKQSPIPLSVKFGSIDPNHVLSLGRSTQTISLSVLNPMSLQKSNDTNSGCADARAQRLLLC